MVSFAIIVKDRKKYDCPGLSFFRWHPMIAPPCLIYAICIRARLSRINDRIKGCGKKDRCLLFNDLRLSYYRAKIPAKVVSVCTYKNRYWRWLKDRRWGEFQGWYYGGTSQKEANQGRVSLSDYDFKWLQRGPNGIIMPGMLYENYILNVSQESRASFHSFWSIYFYVQYYCYFLY